MPNNAQPTLAERVLNADLARRQQYEARRNIDKEEDDDDEDRWASKREHSKKSKSSGVATRWLKLTRQDAPEPGGYMGKCHRHSVTGDITLKKVDTHNDFCIIDLYNRSKIVKPVETIAKDPYLYKPVVMPKRTWIYHDLFRTKKIIQSSDENAMIKYVFSLPAIDAPVSCGLYAPLMAYLPMVLFAVVTKDSLAVASSLIAVVTMGVIANTCNHCHHYYRARLYTIPIRVALVGVLVLSLLSQAELDSAELAGYILCFVTIFMDALLGDKPALFATRFWCHYEIVRELPERLFVCTRVGAAHLEQKLGESPPIPNVIHGLGSWQPRYMLALEIGGMLCKLEPITKQEWEVIYQGYAFEEKNYKYISLGLFSDATPEMYPYDAATDHLGKVMVKKPVVMDVGDGSDDGSLHEEDSDHEIIVPDRVQKARDEEKHKKEEPTHKVEVVDYD